MFDVYIKNFNNSSGTLVTSEKKVFTIPSSRADGYQFIGPTVKSSEDNADSFDFTMEQCSPLYSSLLQLKTLLRVVYDGTTIFNGRVLTISNSTVYQTKRVHCEGSYGYMNDSYYQGVKEKSRSKISWSTYFDRIINNHNTQVAAQNDSPEKYIYRGNVTVDGSEAFAPTTEERKYEPDSWSSTLSLIGNLKNEFGGHFRVRYNDSNGRSYLDWYKYYLRDLGSNRPTVAVGVNITDFNTDTNVDNIFTRVIPTGQAAGGSGDPIYVDGYQYTDKNGNQHTHSGKAIPGSLIRSLYTDSQLNDEFHSASDYSSAEDNYGVIYKVQNFAGASTKEELWNYTKKWMKDCYFGLATSFEIKAVDMHIVDQTKQKILIGDCVNIRYYITENGQRVTKTKKYVCKAISYDLFNPENNTYTFGIPSEILNRTYSEGKKKGSASEETPKGGGGRGGGDPKEFTGNFWTVANYIRMAPKGPPLGGNEAADNFIANGEHSATVYLYDHTVVTGDPYTEENKKLWFKATIVGKITLSGTIFIAKSEYGLCAFAKGPVSSQVWPTSYWYYRGKVNYTAFDPVAVEPVVAGGNVVGTVANIVVPDTITGITNAVNQLSVKIVDNVTSVEWWKSTIQGAQETVQKLSQMTFSEALGSIFGINNNSETTTVEIKGEDGKVELSDSSGDTNVELSGEDATVEVNNPATNRPATIIDGKNKFIKMEKDQNGNWKLQLNVPITYTDASGHTVTTPNAITASDFNIPSIPSFKTKLAVIDELVAGKATIGQLEAAKARITSLESDSIRTNNMSSIDAVFQSMQVTRNLKIGGQLELSNGLYLASNGVWQVSLTDNNNGTYTLKEMKLDGTERNIGTFNKAGGIESVSWGWSAGSARATIRLQGGGTKQYLSPALDSIQKTGDPIWDDDKKKFRQTLTVYDENHLDVYTDEIVGKFDATEAWNAGYAKGSPVSGTASDRPGSSYDWTFAIRRADGTTKNLTINASNIYSDARQGYTMGIFNLATVTLQGTARSVDPVKTTTAIRINSTPDTLYEAGTTTKYDRGTSYRGLKKLSSGGTAYYKAGSATTYYKGNGGQKNAIGSVRYWKRHTTSSDPPTGTYWYSMHTTNPGGTVITNYYAGSLFYDRGDSVSVTPINSSSEVHLDTERAHYPGNGGAFTVQGSSVSAYRKLTSGGTIYYQKASALNLYNAGETVSNTYYTKR